MTIQTGKNTQLQKSAKGFIGGVHLTPKAQRKALAKQIISLTSNSQNTHFIAGTSSNLSSAPPSIVELARGLKNDVDLIHEYCTTQLDYTPVMGLQKGALGAIIDQRGGSFDLADTMIQLLRQAGYTANYLFGELRITIAQAASWFGTWLTDIYAARNLLINGGIGCNVVNISGTDYLEFNHCWVKVWIGSNAYIFDPSLKSYSQISGVNLGVAMGYAATTFLNRAKSGATITTDYVQNINRTNIRSDLNTMTTNLINWINTNNHAATVEEIVGGKTINQITLGQRIIVHPYQKPGSSPSEWVNVPNPYKATLNVVYDNPNINVTFFSADIYGKRLSLFFNASHQAELRLDGSLIATSSAQSPGGWNSVQLNVAHPFGSTWADQSAWLRVYTDQKYIIANAWGFAGIKMAALHNNLFYKNLAATGITTSEPVLGEQLAAMYYAQNAENSRSLDLINRFTNCTTVAHHQIGLVGTISDVPMMDIAMVIVSSSALDNNYDRVKWNDTVGAIHGVTFEASSIQENTGAQGVSCTTMIDTASQNGQKIYDGKSINWTTGVKPNLVGYDPSLLNDIENWYINAGWRIAIPQNGNITIGGFNGYGFWALPNYGAFGIIGGTKGANGASVKSANPVPTPLDGGKSQPNTIAFQDGNFNWNHTDLTIGSDPSEPYGLSFSRYYYASSGSTDGPLGLGWTHNHAIKASVGSSSILTLADNSAIAGAAALVEIFVSLDLLTDLTRPHDKFVISSIAAQWLGDALVNNIVGISGPRITAQFVKIPDGTYIAPPKTSGTLVKNSDGTFSYKTPQQVSYNFNSAGLIATIVYPFGVTWTFTYTSGKLTKVSTGMGRVLNFVYTGTRLSSINDGTGRTVSFALDASKNLIQVTDANSKILKYEYDLPGRMTKVFLPANITSPIVTNIFDSLSQVKEQKDAYNNTTSYYYAGYRSEVIAANGSKAIYYLNRYGDIIKSVDAAGKISTAVYDGLRRLVRRVMPEGNRVEYTFDIKGNVLSEINIAKLGSGLSNITKTYTYHAFFNKPITVTDGLAKSTTFSYDAVTGTLTNVQYPAVGGLTPQDSFTYNSRGQIITATDPTGIVTKFTYDSTTERVLSVIADFGTGRKNLTSNFGHNSRGDVTSIQNARGNTTTLSYDSLRRPTQQTTASPFLYQTKTSYDDNGNILKTERQTGGTPSWQTNEYTYTIDNKNLTAKDPSSNITTRTYDNMRRVWKLTDSLSRVTEYQYDIRGLLVAVRDPSASTTVLTQTFSDNGQLGSTKDARNNTKTITYDGFDRPKRITYPNGSYEEVSSYDANSNILTYRNRDAQTISMTYDNLDRISTKTPQGEATDSFSYDLASRLTSITRPFLTGNGGTGTFTKNYDTAGRLYQEVYPDGKTFTNELDANGNITKTTWPDGYFISRTFDSLDRVTDIKLNGNTASAISYSYDQLSRTTNKTLENGVISTYVWELDDDLASVNHTFNGSNVSFSYTNNQFGEISSKQVSDSSYLWHPAASGIKNFGTASNIDTYPTVGGATQTYNNRGMLTSDGTTSYIYNVAGALKQATKAGTTLDINYDPLNRQVDKTLNGTKSKIYYSGDTRMADYNASGTLLERYIYGPGNEIALKIDSTGNKLFYHTENDGSVIATTNALGVVINKIAYSPLGESNNMAATLFGYRGSINENAFSVTNTLSGVVYNATTGRTNQPSIGDFTGDNSYNDSAPRMPISQAFGDTGSSDGVNLNPNEVNWGLTWGNSIPPFVPPAPPTTTVTHMWDVTNGKNGGTGIEEARKLLGKVLDDLETYARWIKEGGEYDMVKGLYALAALGAFLELLGGAIAAATQAQILQTLGRLAAALKGQSPNLETALAKARPTMEEVADNLVEFLTAGAKRDQNGKLELTKGHQMQRSDGPFGDPMYQVKQSDGSLRTVRFDVDNSHGIEPHVNVNYKPANSSKDVGIGPNNGHLFVNRKD